VLAWRMREPVRGAHERRAMGASEEAALTEEAPPSFAEGWRIVWKIESLRRIWYSLPFLAVALIGFASLSSVLYEQVFDLDERARGFVAAAVEPAQLIGLIVGALGRALHPGKDPLGWLLTLALGVVSLIIAGVIFSNGVLEFIVGIVVAAVLLAIWARLAPRAAH